MKNLKTPRSLEECEFGERFYPNRDKPGYLGVLMALVFGVLGALALVHWWSM